MSEPAVWPEWMNAEEAAEFMGIGERQLRDGMRAGTIPHVRIGDRYLVNRYGLRAWAEEQGRMVARVALAERRMDVERAFLCLHWCAELLREIEPHLELEQQRLPLFGTAS